MGVAVMLACNMGQGARNVLEAQRIEAEKQAMELRA